jgi:anti-anti-sigma factor
MIATKIAALPKEIPMSNSRFPSVYTAVIDSTEFVRGQEQKFLEQLMPLVRAQNVVLDLRNVTRIDAAGLAALITIYCDACKAGHSFRITNPSVHVAELLALVRLDRLLVVEGGDQIPCPDNLSCPDLQLQESAA